MIETSQSILFGQLIASLDQMRPAVLFGPGGVGKSSLGKRLAQEPNVHFHDYDLDLFPECLDLLKRGLPIPTKMRAEYVDRIYDQTERLLIRYPKLVTAQSFLKDFYRREYLERFPNAQFIFLNVPREVRVERIYADEGHIVEPNLRIALGDNFEPITIPYLELIPPSTP